MMETSKLLCVPAIKDYVFTDAGFTLIKALAQIFRFTSFAVRDI